MRVLHLSKYYPPYQGGIETFLYDINEAININYSEIQSDILAVNHEKGTMEETKSGYLIHRANYQMVIMNMPVALNYSNWLRKNASQYDIIHLHYPNPFADLSLILSNYKGKVVVHWHSDIVKQKKLDKIYNPLRNWLLKKADIIIATSPNYANESTQLQKFKNKVVIVPLGLNLDRIGLPQPEKVKTIRETYANKHIIFSLGRQVYYKGFEYLIRSAKHLPDNYIILIGGKGELYDKHQKLINELGLNDKVKMLGFIGMEELPSYYSACDVYTMSSIEKSEAFGVVQLEAMRFGKPLVSTAIACSGVGWVNQDGETGIVVPPKDEKALAKAFIKILEETEINYFENSQKRFFENFTSDKIAEYIIKIYRDLINNDRKQAGTNKISSPTI